MGSLGGGSRTTRGKRVLNGCDEARRNVPPASEPHGPPETHGRRKAPTRRSGLMSPQRGAAHRGENVPRPDAASDPGRQSRPVTAGRKCGPRRGAARRRGRRAPDPRKQGPGESSGRSDGVGLLTTRTSATREAIRAAGASKRNPTAVQSGTRHATPLGERSRRRRSRATVCTSARRNSRRSC